MMVITSEILFILKKTLKSVILQILPFNPQNMPLIQTLHCLLLLFTRILFLLIFFIDLVEKLSFAKVFAARDETVQNNFLSLRPPFWAFKGNLVLTVVVRLPFVNSL